MTRKVTFGLASSVDNQIARRDHTYDWLVWDDEVAAISADFFQTIDTVVMGRKTYEVALKAGGWPATPGVQNYVLSRTLEPGSDSRVEIVDEDAAAFVRRLKEQPGKGICVMGGGELARSLFEEGLIDELGLNVQPVILGEGIPLFHPMRTQIDLELLECRRLKNGSVYVLYRVKR